MKKLIILLVGLGLLSLASAQSIGNVVGRWNRHMLADPPVFVEYFQFNSDSTFKFYSEAYKPYSTYTGTWRKDGNKVVVKILKDNGLALSTSKSYRLVPQSEAGVIGIDDPDFQGHYYSRLGHSPSSTVKTTQYLATKKPETKPDESMLLLLERGYTSKEYNFTMRFDRKKNLVKVRLFGSSQASGVARRKALIMLHEANIPNGMITIEVEPVG